ncbi:hypothetical protein EJB06_30975 [Massilia atriviolacea]|uniref:Uncharacterized protein n=1 Tax=Massilia atriviolacea TaxID=2495579 RepID=A0A430HC78_9BURK|nr:hypothetical protein EJB06_30975 [Massilia atriviolacea]
MRIAHIVHRNFTDPAGGAGRIGARFDAPDIADGDRAHDQGRRFYARLRRWRRARGGRKSQAPHSVIRTICVTNQCIAHVRGTLSTRSG